MHVKQLRQLQSHVLIYLKVVARATYVGLVVPAKHSCTRAADFDSGCAGAAGAGCAYVWLGNTLTKP